MAAEKVTALIRLLYLYEYDEAKVLLSSMRPLDLNTSVSIDVSFGDKKLSTQVREVTRPRVV